MITITINKKIMHLHHYMRYPKTDVKLDEKNVFHHDSLFFLIPQWMIMSYILDCMDTNMQFLHSVLHANM